MLVTSENQKWLRGENKMQQLITAIIATVSLITLILYDLLSLLRIIRKEKWTEKAWRYMLPDKKYDENMLFVGIRPMLLTFSFMTFMLSSGVLSQITWFNILHVFTPLFALGALISNTTRKR